MQVGDGDTIHFFFTDAPDLADGPKRNVYYCKYIGGEFQQADGTTIATGSELPMTTADLELVYDSSASGKHDAWIMDCGVDSDGNPACAYATYPSTTDIYYRYAK